MDGMKVPTSCGVCFHRTKGESRESCNDCCGGPHNVGDFPSVKRFLDREPPLWCPIWNPGMLDRQDREHWEAVKAGQGVITGLTRAGDATAAMRAMPGYGRGCRE
jgi:hypothetical protein